MKNSSSRLRMRNVIRGGEGRSASELFEVGEALLLLFAVLGVILILSVLL